MDYFSKRNIRFFSSFFVKVFCFIILFYSSILLTIDYFEFHYNYKLTIVSNDYELEIPAISFCTHNNQYFDKRKIIHFFNLKHLFNNNYNETQIKKFKNYSNCLNNNKQKEQCLYWQYWEYNKINVFFENFQQNISNLSFENSKSLLIKINELIQCSGVINGESFTNCSEYFGTEENILSNNEFGICFTFNSNIFLKRNDFIEFNIDYESQKNIFKKYSTDETTENEVDILLNRTDLVSVKILFYDFLNISNIISA